MAGGHWKWSHTQSSHPMDCSCIFSPSSLVHSPLATLFLNEWMNGVLLSDCSWVTVVSLKCIYMRTFLSSAKSLPVGEKGALYKSTHYYYCTCTGVGAHAGWPSACSSEQQQQQQQQQTTTTATATTTTNNQTLSKQQQHMILASIPPLKLKKVCREPRAILHAVCACMVSCNPREDMSEDEHAVCVRRWSGSCKPYIGVGLRESQKSGKSTQF